MCGRYLADLGAEVLLVEPPGGSTARRTGPFEAGQSLYFATHNANKLGVSIETTSGQGRDTLLGLLASADIWIETSRPGSTVAGELAVADIRDRYPGLIILSITDFGQTGPYRDWQATDPVLIAMSSFLSRSGLPERRPLIPPGSIAYESAAAQASWAALLAYWNKLTTGVGDHIDFSLYEATVQTVDPYFGAIGSAAVAASSTGASVGPRGRVGSGLYPTFRCSDGNIRIVVLSKRQWIALFEWLGEPEEFADPKYELAANRYSEQDSLNRLTAELFRSYTVSDAVAQGQRRSLPIAPVLTLGEVLSVEHYKVRGALVRIEYADGQIGTMPSGYVEMGGRRAGILRRAPRLGEHNELIGFDLQPPCPPRDKRAIGRRRPLEGLRVLDLGVIVMGGEAGRLLADQGADVVKVENRAYPDGVRVVYGPTMSASFAVGQRNKRGLGINLRSAAGRSVFRRLVAVSDLLLSNFKPGTLESLGFGYDDLKAINPAIVVASTSAYGHTGPWQHWMGYGPLVRCASGVTDLWQYSDTAGSFGEPVAYFPDHFAARLVVTASLAALIQRRQSGLGTHITASEAEAVLVSMSDLVLEESVRIAPESGSNRDDAGLPWGLYPCLGDDEWCVVTVRDSGDWDRLVNLIGNPTSGRQDRQEMDAWLSSWTSQRSPQDVVASMQRAGVPAGWMARGAELASDPHLLERGFFALLDQPGLEKSIPMERGPFLAERIAEPALRPAPLHGEHTRLICREWLGMQDDEIDQLLADGALE